jgi:hypothetical protein
MRVLGGGGYGGDLHFTPHNRALMLRLALLSRFVRELPAQIAIFCRSSRYSHWLMGRSAGQLRQIFMLVLLHVLVLVSRVSADAIAGFMLKKMLAAGQ